MPPTASFTATPNPVNTGTAVSFNGSGSTDPDGTIAKYEWDLDGNGTYETSTGTTATTSRTYTTAGTVAVKLRVTDSDGLTATTGVTVTVNNRPPVPSFTVTPSPANTRQTVTLNGSGSTDPDGTIAKYEWDLDGNGTYETSTGTTATTTKSFTATATLTLGLRTTDNSGATATTTRSLTVNSAYRAAVLGTTGISDLWRLDETTGTTATDANGANNNGTYTSSPTLGGAADRRRDQQLRPLLQRHQPVHRHVADAVRHPLDLLGRGLGPHQRRQSLGRLPLPGQRLERDFDNGFSLVIDSSNRPIFVAARENIIGRSPAARRPARPRSPRTRPTSWSAPTTAAAVRIYVDGVERANANFSGAVTWPSSRDLRVGRPISSTSLAQRYLQGSIDEPALYTTALSAATVLAHYEAGKP